MWPYSRWERDSVEPNSGMTGANSVSCGTVSMTITTPDPTPARQHQIVGIDVCSRSPLYGGHAGQPSPVLLGKGDTSEGGPLRPPAETTGAEKALARPRAAASRWASERDG